MTHLDTKNERGTKMTTVAKLISDLQKLPGDLPVYTVQGASGAVDEVGTPFLGEAHENEIAMGLDLEEGEEYVWIYIGN